MNSPTLLLLTHGRSWWLHLTLTLIHGLWQGKKKYLCKKKNYLFYFLRPFDRFTWLALALTGTVVLMVFFLGNGIVSVEKLKSVFAIFILKKLAGRHSHFDKICGFLVRGLFSQSAHWIPSQMSYQRILSVAWVTLIFFLAQFYSGTLVSMFAVPSLHIEVNR